MERHTAWSVDDITPDEGDHDEVIVKPQTWERVKKEKERELAALVKEGALQGQRKGKALRPDLDIDFGEPSEIDKTVETYRETLRDRVEEQWHSLGAVAQVISEVALEFDGEGPALPELRSMLDHTREKLAGLHDDAQRYVGPFELPECDRGRGGLGAPDRGAEAGGMTLSSRSGHEAPCNPGPKPWCPNGCGNLVDNIGAPGHEGAVLVLLGHEPFWFCGVACAASFLQETFRVIYEGEGSLWFLLRNIVSDN